MKGELETLHKSIRKRLPQRRIALCDGKGPDKKALLSLGRNRAYTGVSRALRSREMLGRLDSILLSSLQGDFFKFFFKKLLLHISFSCLHR